MSRANYLRERVADARANGRCITCIRRRVLRDRSRCRHCVDAARRRYDKALSNGLCGECRRYPVVPNRARCEHCAERASARAAGIETIRYVPLDEWLAKPITRVMRALRRLGWATSGDMIEALGAAEHEHEALKQALYTLQRTGRAERRAVNTFHGSTYEYRLAAGVRCEAPNDTAVCA